MTLKNYISIFDKCLNCNCKEYTIKLDKYKILKTEILDFPQATCSNCGQVIIANELSEALKKVLKNYDIYPPKMTLEQIRNLDRDKVIPNW